LRTLPTETPSRYAIWELVSSNRCSGAAGLVPQSLQNHTNLLALFLQEVAISTANVTLSTKGQVVIPKDIQSEKRSR